jgi:hypothetical protein
VKKYSFILGLLFFAVLGVLLNADPYWKTAGFTSNSKFTKDVWTVGGQISTLHSVSLTSPTVAISAAGKTGIVISSNANQTGHKLVGGTLGQRVSIVTGAGSNTLRFDDSGTTMALGSNITLTEGQGDTLELVCTSTTGALWSKTGGSDN